MTLRTPSTQTFLNTSLKIAVGFLSLNNQTSSSSRMLKYCRVVLKSSIRSKEVPVIFSIFIPSSDILSLTVSISIIRGDKSVPRYVPTRSRLLFSGVDNVVISTSPGLLNRSVHIAVSYDSINIVSLNVESRIYNSIINHQIAHYRLVCSLLDSQ